eukprot:TRINITY_DN4004_c0_g1_i5.p1 TRINITY_DN4004_c0_g1~~TRINITY_DN4004_c0_g1_i5.p1  ORF type:complete len:859 (+),score=105.27 TRINITY_DN4004_c0_g1_i5:1211-3787(+)
MLSRKRCNTTIGVTSSPCMLPVTNTVGPSVSAPLATTTCKCTSPPCGSWMRGNVPRTSRPASPSTVPIRNTPPPPCLPSILSSDVDHLAFSYIDFPQSLVRRSGSGENEQRLRRLVSFTSALTDHLPLEAILNADKEENIQASAQLFMNLLHVTILLLPSLSDAMAHTVSDRSSIPSEDLLRKLQAFLIAVPLENTFVSKSLELGFAKAYADGDTNAYTLALLIVLLFKRPPGLSQLPPFATQLLGTYVLPRAESIGTSEATLYTIQAVLPTVLPHVEPEVLLPLYDASANAFSLALANILNRQLYDNETLTQAKLSIEALSSLYGADPEYMVGQAVRKQLSLLERMSSPQSKSHPTDDLDIATVRLINSIVAGDSTLLEPPQWHFVFTFLSFAIERLLRTSETSDQHLQERVKYRVICVLSNLVSLPPSVTTTFDGDLLAIYQSFVATSIIPTVLLLCRESGTTRGLPSRILTVVHETVRNIGSPIILQRVNEIKGASAELYDLLNGKSLAVQKTAYRLLLHWITFSGKTLSMESVPREQDEKESEKEAVVEPPLDKELRRWVEADILSSIDQRTPVVGYWLAWSLIFDLLTVVSSPVRTSLITYLRQSGVFAHLLSSIFAFVDLQVKLTPEDITTFKIVDVVAWDQRTIQCYITHLYLRALAAAPVLVRLWWADECDRSTAALVEKYTTAFVSPILADNELAAVSTYEATDENFKVRAIPLAREVVATYEKDEMHMSIVLRLPPSYPLRTVEIECKKKMGLSDSQWRKWVLSMTTLFLTQDASVLDAILLWKQNLDKHFEGVESCPICYSIFHITDSSLPKLSCKTCHNKFHSACMYKWIRVSHNTECPLCKSTLL